MRREIGRVPASAVREGALVRVERPPFHLLVTRIAGRAHAIEDACPHSGASLCEGSIEGSVVTCPAHGWQIDVESGEVLTAAGRGERSPRFTACEQDGVVVLYE